MEVFAARRYFIFRNKTRRPIVRMVEYCSKTICQLRVNGTEYKLTDACLFATWATRYILTLFARLIRWQLRGKGRLFVHSVALYGRPYPLTDFYMDISLSLSLSLSLCKYSLPAAEWLPVKLTSYTRTNWRPLHVARSTSGVSSSKKTGATPKSHL